MQETSEESSSTTRPAHVQAFWWRTAWLLTWSAAALTALLAERCSGPGLVCLAVVLGSVGAVSLAVWIYLVLMQAPPG
ncbi:MAG: hypothetical protein EKK53_17395 [Burkholderiales bacterium]|nr:MAG: hypothetical protein EKK53_17395 [Burkholderiales bacterium]